MKYVLFNSTKKKLFYYPDVIHNNSKNVYIHRMNNCLFMINICIVSKSYTGRKNEIIMHKDKKLSY